MNKKDTEQKTLRVFLISIKQLFQDVSKPFR